MWLKCADNLLKIFLYICTHNVEALITSDSNCNLHNSCQSCCEPILFTANCTKWPARVSSFERERACTEIALKV